MHVHDFEMGTWGWEGGENPDPLLLVSLEANAVVFIKDGAPGVDVDDGHRTRDEQHERELHHVADLHQHDGGDEGQHGHVVVILGVLHAAILYLHPCSAVGSRGVLEAAKLKARTTGSKGTADMVREGSVVAEDIQLPPPQLPQKHRERWENLPRNKTNASNSC